MFNIFKGWIGEKVTQAGIWLTLDKSVYRPFHDLTLKDYSGTTQIDHVLLSPYGLFVIETKNYRGWNFGGEHQPQWTQVLYRAKHRFQNPLRQNYRHTTALAEALGIPHHSIHSIVFFICEAEFKTPVPPNVLAGGLASYVKRFRDVVFAEDELHRLGGELHRLKQVSIPRREHIRNLQERNSDRECCPKCNSPLVRRTATKGAYKGVVFLGCASFPGCRYVKRL